MDTMTTAEAIVASLVAHGIKTVYALPGVHNDHLFDALFKASDSIGVVHPRHEQGAGYMALGAATATGRPSAYAVVPGPGLLNTGAALLTAYAMNAPVLGLIGQIPDADIGRGIGHLHEIRDQAGIISRLVDFSARIRGPDAASALVAKALAAMGTRRRGPAVLECAIDVWGRSGPAALVAPLTPPEPEIDEDAIAAAAAALGAAKRPFILCGGGAQGAATEVTALAHMLQAPVLGYRRGRGVLDSRDPLSVTLPLGRDLWAEADVVLAVGTRMYYPFTQWGVDDDIKIIRIDSNPEEPARVHEPAVALIGDAQPILRRLVDAVAARNTHRSSRTEEMRERHARWNEKMRSPRWASSPASPFPSTSRGRSFRPAIRTISAGVLPPRSARRTRGATCRWSRSAATAASCSPRMSSRPPCAIAFRWWRWCFRTAHSAMSAASRRSATATA
jgi:acetolactate synthase-1/2/3 large subunit